MFQKLSKIAPPAQANGWAVGLKGWRTIAGKPLTSGPFF
jgi:hypothetical protein